MPHDVFISYAAHENDQVVADAVCARLEERGIRCWLAPRDVGRSPHSRYPAAIAAGIRDSRVFVLVFSGNANKSRFVVLELERAIAQGIPVIPLRIENVVPEDDMDLLLAATNWLDALTPPLEKHLDELADRVQLLLGLAVPTPPPPPPPPPPPWWRVILAALARPRRRTAVLWTIAIATTIALGVGSALYARTRWEPPAPDSGGPFTQTADPLVDRITREPPSGATSIVHGRLLHDGKPVSGADVRAEKDWDETSLYTAKTDRDGEYRLDLPAGEYFLTYRLPNGQARGRGPSLLPGYFVRWPDDVLKLPLVVAEGVEITTPDVHAKYGDAIGFVSPASETTPTVSGRPKFEWSQWERASSYEVIITLGRWYNGTYGVSFVDTATTSATMYTPAYELSPGSGYTCYVEAHGMYGRPLADGRVNFTVGNQGVQVTPLGEPP